MPKHRYIMSKQNIQWSCKYCSFKCSKRPRLLDHYVVNHFREGRRSQIPCLYQACPLLFRKKNSLKAHISKAHDSVSGTAECQLQCLNCKEIFASLNELLKHLRRHVLNHQAVKCPFSGCTFQSRVASTFAAHLSRTHTQKNISCLSTEVCIKGAHAAASTSTMFPVDEPVESDIASYDFCTGMVSYESPVLSEKQLENHVARFCLKMSTVLHISRSSIQEVIEDINHIHELSESHLFNAVKKLFEENGIDIQLVGQFVNFIMKEMPFYKLTSSSLPSRGTLCSARLRDSYVKANMPYLSPVEYDLGYSAVGKQCKFIYVPILQAIQNQLRRPDVLHEVLRRPTSVVGVYKCFLDGSNFVEQSNDESFKIYLTLYIDEWESVNPLGTSRKIHKITSIYWVFSVLDPKLRSQLHVMQLACLARHSDVKYFGYSKILHPLLRDLSFLEQKGVCIDALGENVRGAVVAVVADNLSAHSLGGFVESFGQNVTHPCRFCVATSEAMQDCALSVYDFKRRNPADHACHVREAEDTQKIIFGVKRASTLQTYLTMFDITRSLPPDVSHDLLEGIVPVEIALSLGVMVSKGYFTLPWLNSVIRTFPYKFTDAYNKPHPIPENFAANGTIGGNATENWTLLRLLPVLIGSRVPRDESAWDLLMDLKEIVELCFSPAISEASVGYLASKIADHKFAFKQLFPDVNFKPKHHFVEHYPQLIREFGPLVHMWTMRFEAKHSYFKRIVREARSFKNILMTLAEKHQLMVAYNLSSPTYFVSNLDVPESASIHADILCEAYRLALKQYSPDVNCVTIVPHATVYGTKYSPGMIVVTGYFCGLPKFAEILEVMLIMNTVCFVVEALSSWYIEHVRGYCIERTGNLEVLQVKKLYDYYPLVAYRYDSEHWVVLLKHSICSATSSLR